MARGGIGRLRAAVAAALVCSPLACSLLSSDDAFQCRSDADCERFPGTICQTSVCRDRPSLADAGNDARPPSCSSNQDCPALTGEEHSICKRDTGVCQSLVSHDCGRVLGSVKSDDVVVFGAMARLFGEDALDAEPLVQALSLAVADLTFGSLPRPGGARGSIAFVLCDETDDAARAARHLVTDVGVPAIVTRARDDVLAVTGPASVMTISPALHVAASSTGPLDFALLPPGAAEASALQAVLTGLVAPSISARGTLRMVTLHERSPYGDEITGTQLTLGEGSLPALDVSIDDPDLPSYESSYTTAVSSVLSVSPLPDVIALVGGERMARRVLHGLETGWPPGGVRPIYLVSDAAVVPSLLAEVALRADLGARLLAVAPAPAAQPSAAVREELFVHVRDQASSPIDPRARGVSAGYDAAFLLAALVSATPPSTTTGAGLAGSLPLLSTGPATLRASRDGLADALTALAAGSSRQLVGATGALPLDPATRDLSTAFEVLCVTGTPPELAPGGVRIDQGVLSGKLAAACMPSP